MRVAIVGAGAIGSLIGHGLQLGGNEVTLLDLPARIEQIRAMGNLMILNADCSVSSVRPSLATVDYALAGLQDVVILATKSHHLPTVAPHVPKLIGSETVVLTVQNGIPWWYLQGMAGPHAAARIRCLDPDGSLERNIPSERLIGCIAYPAAHLEADGRVRHVEGRRFPVGELDGSIRERTQRIAAMFDDGGFRSRAIADIRSELWLKALGSVSINPISALTRATMVEICSFPATRQLVATMMQEAKNVAEALGASLRHTIEERIDGAKAVGAHKTSMLQDLEAGRSLELDALVLAVLELAELTRTSTPTIRSIYACAALLNEPLRQAEQMEGRV